jgi:predicted O-methyltransferase YrrM
MPDHATNRPCTDEEFFVRHYARLVTLLDEFTRTSRQSLVASDPRHTLPAMITVANDILSEGLAVAGVESSQQPPVGATGFVRSADTLCHALRESPRPRAVAAAEEMANHLSYLIQHINESELDTATNNVVQATCLQDCLFNYLHALITKVFSLYQWTCPDPRDVVNFFDATATEAMITPKARSLIASAASLEGWCSSQKSLLLYSLARNHQPKTVVEIGVYGGRSIVPLAAAIRDNAVGNLYGIETWSGSHAIAYRTNIGNDFWWNSIDYARIKIAFLAFLVQHQLHDTIRLIEAPSERCAGLFDSIDMLHIDGGHSAFGSAQDVITFLIKVPPGGIIVYDDINWPSNQNGLNILRDTCRLLEVVPAYDTQTEAGCAAFIKI